MQKRKVLEDSDDDVPIFGPNGLLEDADRERIKQEQKKRRERKKQRPHGSDSDEDVPFFFRREEEQESQQPFTTTEDYLPEEVAGLSQAELNAEAVDEAQFRLATYDSLASTPSKNEVEVQVSRSLYDAEDLVRVAAAKMNRFTGKATLKITKWYSLPLIWRNRLQFFCIFDLWAGAGSGLISTCSKMERSGNWK
jgi:hypothetical protein